jgi:uncharacterized membrane protein
MTPNGWLHLFSALYLALVMTLVLGILEFDDVRSIARSTLRRWLKLIGALVAIAIVVQTCTFAGEKNRQPPKKSLDASVKTALPSTVAIGLTRSH